MNELRAKYKVACKEFDRLMSLLGRNMIKSTADWQNLQRARMTRDALALELEQKQRAG